jgi:ribosome-binding protein aMBF1 (putative translation factor)
MSVHTKKPRIRRVNKKPSKGKSIHWREVFKKELKEYGEVALALRGARHKEEMAQEELARALGIRQHHISEMEHGKRPIGKAMAKKLAKIFKVDYRLFL